MASFMASSSLRSYLHRSPNGLINFGLPRRSLLTRRVNEASDLTVTSGLHCVCETCLFLLKSSFSSTCSPRIHLSSNILTSTLFCLFSTSSAKFSFYFIPLDGACRSHILFFSVLFIRKKKSAIWITEGGSVCRIYRSRLHQKMTPPQQGYVLWSVKRLILV